MELVGCEDVEAKSHETLALLVVHHFLVMSSLYRGEFYFKPSVPEEKLEQVVRNSDKEVVTIISL